MGVEMKEKLAPNWILDRRDSGRLFWRRDSAGIPSENGSAVNRVKFRCDVEILEFLKSDDENFEELSSSDDYDSEDEYGWGGHGWKPRNKEEMPPPSSLVGGLCIIVIIAVLTYQWLYSNSKTLK